MTIIDDVQDDTRELRDEIVTAIRHRDRDDVCNTCILSCISSDPVPPRCLRPTVRESSGMHVHDLKMKIGC